MKDISLRNALIVVLFTIVGGFGYQMYQQWNQPTYERGTVVYVTDGDSFFVMRNLGTTDEYQDEIRLHGLNAPELHGPHSEDGYRSKDALTNMIGDKEIFIRDFHGHRGKYDRLIAIVYIDQGDSLVNINRWLVLEGLAEPRDYGMGAIK